MKLDQIRTKYLQFFKERGHTILPSSSLVPENDPTTLFTGSGMQPMLPYLLGQTHPMGTRVADAQKSFRTVDIDEVGDSRHTTFFEMIGNWSFGDYFQEEQLNWVFEFLIGEVKIDPNKLYVTVFGGDKENDLPRDTRAAEIWKDLFKGKGIDAREADFDTEENAAKVGMHGERIFYYGAKCWWSRAGVPDKMPIGEPGGPDSEMFYEFEEVEHNPKYGLHCHPNCDCGRFVEIGNSVFMQFVKVADKKFERLPKKNIDFGGGLERIAMAAQNKSDIFRLDVFDSLLSKLENISGTSYADSKYTFSYCVIADHLRASVFLIGDGVLPGNTDQGYFVRRLLRRAVTHWDKLGIRESGLSTIVDSILDYYKDSYPDTYNKKDEIKNEIQKEEDRFRKTLKDGLRQFEKITLQAINKISGVDAFNLLQSYGFPLEVTMELAKEKGMEVEVENFKEELKRHQDLSRAGAEKKFKGGLGDTSEMSLKYHTTTHLLNAALRKVLGSHVGQKGSNITPERLRFDFTHPSKLSDEEKKKIEDQINEWITADLPVTFQELPKAEAEKVAIHAFGDKYGDVVNVYSIGTEKAYISREFCGGPHVTNTGILGKFKIQKEEAVSQGVRRIKAVLS